MRSAFFRQMAVISIVILLTILSLFSAFQIAITQYLEQENRERLSANARSVIDLANAYSLRGDLAGNRHFFMSLSFSAEMAGIDVVVCDTRGIVRLCSCKGVYCPHLGKRVDEDFAGKILEQGEHYGVAEPGDLYEEQRYTEGLRLVSNATGQTLGLILVSAPVKNTASYQRRMFRVFFVTALAVLLGAMAVTYVLSHNEVRPVLELTDAVRKFGHGKLDTRVRVEDMGTREMTQLAQSFNSMANQLEKTERQRQEFVANVSHELKTPMTNISGYMDGILDGVIPPEEHRHYMTMISREIRRLDRLVRSMLDISRMQSEVLSEERKERFDLSEAALQTMAVFEQKMQKLHLQVEADLPDDPAWTFANKDYVVQVIGNLVDNAVKYCPEGGRLTVSLRQKKGKHLLSVENTGPTIPAEELPFIFDRFHKLDKSRSRDKTGVGLGLYIVKTILGIHGEDIRVESHDGITTFTFTMPVVK